MKEALRRPLGLVLPGGGSLGAWQAAALARLLRRGFSFDAVIGFSAGALNGCAYALGRLEEALRRWRSGGATLRLAPRLSPLSLFSDRSIKDSIDFIGEDDQARKDLRIPLVVVSTARSRERLVYARYEPGGAWDGPLSAHLVASCSIPMVFPPVHLSFRGVPAYLVDGGVPCAEPLSFDGVGACPDVVVLDCISASDVVPFWAGFGWERGSRRSVRRLVDQGVAALAASGRRVLRLEPSAPLSASMLNFHPRVVGRALSLGEHDGERFLS